MAELTRGKLRLLNQKNNKILRMVILLCTKLPFPDTKWFFPEELQKSADPVTVVADWKTGPEAALKREYP